MNQSGGGRHLIIRKKKEWLRDKILALRTSYMDTLNAFRDKLDGIVAEPMQVACRLVEQSENTLCLQQIAMVGFSLEECNNQLFDLLLSIYPSESGNEQETYESGGSRPGMPNTAPNVANALPIVVPAYGSPIHMLPNQPSQAMDYMQLDTSLATSGCFQNDAVYRSEDESSEVVTAAQDMNLHDAKNTQSIPSEQKNQVDLSSTISSIHGATATHSTPIPAGSLTTESETEARQDDAKISELLPESNTESKGTFQGTISDVMSPDQFSIQMQHNKLVIKKLQKDLNEFYGSCENLADYEFLKIPDEGQQCAVIYQPDNSWYRACVTKIIDQSLISVEYIDYGNVDEVPWCLALKLDPAFSKPPRLSMCCCLADVAPLKPENSDISTDDSFIWDVSTIEWFDKFVYGQTYQVVVSENQDSEFATSVRLYYTECGQEKEPVMWSVAKLMVCLRLAIWQEPARVVRLDQENLETLKIERALMNHSEENTGTADIVEIAEVASVAESQHWSDGIKCSSTSEGCDGSRSTSHSQQERVKEATPAAGSSKESNTGRNCRGNTTQTTEACIGVVKKRVCIPAGMERSHNRTLDSKPSDVSVLVKEDDVQREKSIDQTRLTSGSAGRILPNHCHSSSPTPQIKPPSGRNGGGGGDELFCKPASLLTPTSSITPELVDDERPDKDEDVLKSWNPMEDDFKSPRNRYSVDTENACAVVEGINPEEIKVCRHYVRGRCWNGDRCPNVHPRRSYNGEVKTEIRTFSASNLKSLSFKEGSWSIVQVTSIISTDYFYVHVIQSITGMGECIAICRQNSRIPPISPHLSAMMKDMQQYYSRNLRATALTRPCGGELYVVHVPQDSCFYRGMILVVSYDIAKVHLVDFGRDVSVPTRYLRPMCDAFMHLPRQAILCSLSGCNNQDFKRVQDFVTSVQGARIAMEVTENRCIETDGPLGVSLYGMDKDGMRHIDVC